nr:hypothetical protein [Tanacetum cinerariifolium]
MVVWCEDGGDGGGEWQNCGVDVEGMAWCGSWCGGQRLAGSGGVASEDCREREMDERL